MTDLSECSFKWYAPYLHPNGNITRTHQKCSLPKEHEGDHMSRSKVTAPNDPGYTGDV